MTSVPELSEGQVSFEWVTDLPAPVICHLAYEPETGDGFHEPRYEAGVTLEAAYSNGVNILPLLSFEQISEIEQLALAQVDEDCAEAIGDAAIDAYEDRRGQSV